MKYLLYALLLVSMLPMRLNALIRSRNNAPVLHSILDAPQQRAWNESAFLRCSGANESFGPRHSFDPDKAARRQEAGIYMMVFGAALMALGAGIIINAPSFDPATSTNAQSYARGVTQMLGAVVGVAGLGLFVPGLIMLLYYSSKRNRWY